MSALTRAEQKEEISKLLEKITKSATNDISGIPAELLEVTLENTESAMARVIEIYGTALAEKLSSKARCAEFRRTPDGGKWSGNPLGYMMEGDASEEIAFAEKLRHVINLLDLRHRGLTTRLSKAKVEFQANMRGR